MQSACPSVASVVFLRAGLKQQEVLLNTVHTTNVASQEQRLFSSFLKWYFYYN